MNREDVKKLLLLPYGYDYKAEGIKEANRRAKFVINKIYNYFNNELDLIAKENIRLKKQLSKDHHVECSCSFCKPIV